MAWVNVVELIYPVGSVYSSDNTSQSPSDMFGGTWDKAGKTTTVADGSNSPSTVIYHWRRVS